MAEKILADASPEKRLFISLLTRDILLVAAFLDLIDNSINAAMEPHSGRLRTAVDYVEFLKDKNIKPSIKIKVKFDKDRVEISDNAGGISAKTARNHVFKFGRGSEDDNLNKTDRLSVYGIGLKRAMFKLGNNINMTSDHIEGGFDMKLDVQEWERKVETRWQFEIEKRSKSPAEKVGTKIIVRDLYDEVRSRLQDGVFESQLREAISRTYAYFLAKLVVIELNDRIVDGISISIGENHSSETFNYENVSCAVTAGIGVPQGGGFRDKSAGWFVFCNGRAVVSADKSQLTGWGSSLPIFQPKHRPFLGTVYFVSEYPEELPWNTTKSAINEDSSIWQITKRQIATIGRVVITFLDGRYTDEGVEIRTKELQEALGGSSTSIFDAAISEKKTFSIPKRPKATTTKIQYDAKVQDIKRIAEYLGQSSMNGSAVGRHTFNHFLVNEVGEN